MPNSEGNVDVKELFIPFTIKCCRCGTNKSLLDFHKDKSKKLGRTHACRACLNTSYNNRMRQRGGQKQNPVYNASWKAARRKKVIDAYGGLCACCGLDEYVFLAIDHINDDGAEHRRKIGGSGALVTWIIKNNFPAGFQILCHNCNFAKFHGGCPHA